MDYDGGSNLKGTRVVHRGTDGPTGIIEDFMPDEDNLVCVYWGTADRGAVRTSEDFDLLELAPPLVLAPDLLAEA